MNALGRITVLQPDLDPVEQGRITTLSRFSLEQFQNMTQADLLLAQSISGHGDTWGVWKTPKALYPGKLGDWYRTVDLAKRLRDCLAKEALPDTSPDMRNALVGEGVLVLTRLALLLRLAPTGGTGYGKTQRLKPSTLAQQISSQFSSIVARAIRRKATRLDARGLFGCLNEDDVRELAQYRPLRVELERLATLAARGWWADLPPQPDITRTTDPRGPKSIPIPEKKAGEYQPIPDAYLADFGPRNLWLIRDLAPNLLPMLEDFATYLENLDWSKITKNNFTRDNGLVAKFISSHLREHPWKDRAGRPLRPTFPLKSGARNNTDKFEWPPRKYDQLKVLSSTLQSAHLFLTMLASAGRIGEVETLPRSCVTTERDGKDYVSGWTYKLSDNLFGDARQWPAPTVLVQALGQQVRLANVWSRMPPVRFEDGLPTTPPAHDALWLSLGSGSAANAAEPLGSSLNSLMMLAERIGMNPKPGGINLHPHRCRKTIGRLAGVTLFNSPLVLKRLFGHKSIEMTLRYILCNKDIRTEAEAVLRELRIVHCAQALEEVREALATGSPLPGHNGVAVSRMVDAVREHEDRLTKSCRVWRDGSAYDLAYMLTSSGQGWRFVRKNIVCAKVPGEGGLCRKNRGEPNTANCKPGCSNRIVLALERSNVGEVVESYIDVASQARDEGQHMVFYESMLRLLEEINTFPDLKSQYLADQRIQLLLVSYEELNQ
ncbi:hypothetical protein [Comamonas sp.]|uniref:hypothetical protein n=1 Tax=Comamonas sp. TaxID=34028 RepID=UPI003A8C9FC1